MWGQRLRRALTTGVMAMTLALGTAAPVAAQDEQGFQAYLTTLRQQASAEGVTQRTIDAVFPTLTLSERTIQLDRAQPGNPGSTATPPFAPYKASHVDAARIGRGRTTYQAQRARLARVERETGVPESIMVAIWGHETNYGAYTGNFDLLRSLASLAYEGRRRWTCARACFR
jgi:membrane-bound lytic murein transglycosylase B